MSTTLLKFVPFLLAVGSVCASEEVVKAWDFRSGNLSVEDWLADWKPQSKVGGQEGALRVEQPPGNVQGDHTALILEDVYDSSADQGNDADGTPKVSWEFEPVSAGSLNLRVGTAGTQNQNGEIALLARGRPLLVIKITNNTTGLVVSGSGETEFSDSASWFNRARNLEIRWTADGDVMVSFIPENGDALELGPLQFLAPGAPDELTMQVGFGRATNKALRIESLSLHKNQNQ